MSYYLGGLKPTVYYIMTASFFPQRQIAFFFSEWTIFSFVELIFILDFLCKYKTKPVYYFFFLSYHFGLFTS